MPPAGRSSSLPSTEGDAGIEAPALRRLYDGIYERHDGSDGHCPVSTGNLDKARQRVHQVLKGLGLFSKGRPIRVLDIGSGLGFTSEALRELGATVTAIDLSPVAVAKAKERFKGIDFRCSFFPEGLPEEKTFDLIWAVDLPVVGLFESENIHEVFLNPCLKRLNNNGHVVVGWHTDFSGQQTNGWVNWSLMTIRSFRRTFRSSPALIPQLRFFWLSACICLACRLLRRSAPIYFSVCAADWPDSERQ